jgi:ABC-type Fe3+ transport system permease subunit
MSSDAAVLALVVLALGGLMGWHANRARAAHGDLRTTRGRLPGFRQTRLTSGLIAIVMLVVALFVIHDLIGQ